MTHHPFAARPGYECPGRDLNPYSTLVEGGVRAGGDVQRVPLMRESPGQSVADVQRVRRDRSFPTAARFLVQESCRNLLASARRTHDGMAFANQLRDRSILAQAGTDTNDQLLADCGGKTLERVE